MYALNMTSLEHGDRVYDSALASFLEYQDQDQDSAVVALVADWRCDRTDRFDDRTDRQSSEELGKTLPIRAVAGFAVHTPYTDSDKLGDEPESLECFNSCNCPGTAST